MSKYGATKILYISHCIYYIYFRFRLFFMHYENSILLYAFKVNFRKLLIVIMESIISY